MKLIFICRILKHKVQAILREKTGMNDPLDFKIKEIEGNDAQENALFYPSKHTFDHPNSHGK